MSMKLDKAREILTLWLPTHRWPPNPDLQDAMKLGIEAIKRIKSRRDLGTGW